MKKNNGKKVVKLLLRGSISLAFLIFSILMLSACHTDYDLSIDEYDTIKTNYDPNADFQINQTYSRTDIVVDLDLEDGEPHVPGDHDDHILQQVDTQMQAMGYSMLAAGPGGPNPDADVAIVVSKTKQDYFARYWWSYPGYWWGCCGYYPGGSTIRYVYTGGTVFIDMANYKSYDKVNDENPPPKIWAAGINGVLNDSSGNIENRLTTTITQAFSQSPYLDVN